LIITYAPKNGMKVGQVACNPCRRASKKCPSSCTRMSRTKPTANFQPQISAYPPTAMKMLKNLSAAKPNFAIRRMAAPIGAQMRRSIPRQSVPRG